MVQDITAFRCQENVNNYILLNRTWRLTTVFKKTSQKNLSLSISRSFFALWYPFHIIPFSGFSSGLFLWKFQTKVYVHIFFPSYCMKSYPFPSFRFSILFCFPVKLSSILTVFHETFFSHNFNQQYSNRVRDTHTHGQIKLRLEFKLCIFVCRFLERGHKNKNWMNKWNIYFVMFMIREFVWILSRLLYFGFVIINSIQSINDFIKVYFLHCFVQQHVSALVMSHLQVDYFTYWGKIYN